MRLKTIFLIFALAMLMLAGVAWAEDDDDQGDNGYNDPLDPTCPIKVIIANTDLEDYPEITAAFDYKCAQVNVSTRVRARLLPNEDDDDGDPPWLTDVEDIFEATIPATAVVCAVCDPITIQYYTATSCPSLNEAIYHTAGFKLKHIYELYPAPYRPPLRYYYHDDRQV